jgi:hypothetical protein
LLPPPIKSLLTALVETCVYAPEHGVQKPVMRRFCNFSCIYV